jgi:hypothetical protein
MRLLFKVNLSCGPLGNVINTKIKLPKHSTAPPSGLVPARHNNKLVES